MLKILSLLVLLVITTNCFYVFSDPSTTTIQHPLYSYTILQKNYSMIDPNPMEYGVNWIWTNGTSRIATFETIFIAPYAAQGELNIKANNSYYAYVNGISVRAGSKNLSESTAIRLSCGINNLTIKVENTDPNATTSGVAFRIYQQDSLIPTCTNNGFYNYSSCACQCLGSFTCLTTQLKAGYPICGCKCINQGILSCNSNRQYFDQKMCSCQCLPIYCRPGYEQDPVTCNCRCKASQCTTGIWNYNQCMCL